MTQSILRHAATDHCRVTLTCSGPERGAPYFVTEYVGDRETNQSEYSEYPDAYGVYLDVAIDTFRRERSLHRGSNSAITRPIGRPRPPVTPV